MPFPSEETTPPVMKMNRVLAGGSAWRSGAGRFITCQWSLVLAPPEPRARRSPRGIPLHTKGSPPTLNSAAGGGPA